VDKWRQLLELNHPLRLFELADWINTTPAHAWARSLTVATRNWALLAVQIVHVLGICLLAGSIGVFSLRMMRIVGRSQTLAALARRLLPWAWGAIAVQLLTGIFMVIERPERAMGSLTFPYKMLFLVAAIAVTTVFTVTTRRDPAYWDRDGNRRIAAHLMGTLSLALWIAVIFTGRWIAYERVPA
jgi:hypothetical protein